MSKLFVDEIQPKTTGGVFTTPALAFMAQKTDVTTYTTSGNITFNSTLLSTNSWNGTTFTIPKAGIYRFFVKAYVAVAEAVMASNFVKCPVNGCTPINGMAYSFGYLSLMALIDVFQPVTPL